MTLLGRRLRAGCYEEVALSLALGLARALAKLPPDGLEGLLEVLEGASPVSGFEFQVSGAGVRVLGPLLLETRNLEPETGGVEG